MYLFIQYFIRKTCRKKSKPLSRNIKMISFTCFVVVILAVIVTASNPGLRVQRKIDVYPKPEGYNSELPVVHGVRNCGGRGKYVAFRLDGCSPDSICRIPGDSEPRASELEFVPSADSDAIGIRLNLLQDGTADTVYERPVSDSAVQGGKTFIIGAHGYATEEFKGKTVTIQYIVYRVDDDDVEVCAEADFEVY